MRDPHEAFSIFATLPQRMSDVENARHCITTLRGSRESVTVSLARSCQAAQRGLSAGLDEKQVAGIELAWASADALAVEATLASLGPAQGAFETALGLVFVVDAMVAAIERLDTICLDLGKEELAVDPRTGARFVSLRRLATAASALEAVGV